LSITDSNYFLNCWKCREELPPFLPFRVI
jgi:hypothetical protein